MNQNLSSLLTPAQLNEFTRAFKNNRPFFAERVTRAFDFPFLQSLEELLKVWDQSIQVHLPDLRDEASSIDTDANGALAYYQQGMGLLFNNAQSLSPELEVWIQGVRAELGLSQLTYGRNLIYATPDGKGTAPHFDQNINFVFQVRGIKRWRVAENRHILNPMTRHTMGQPADPEMMSYLEGPLPLEMPDDAEEFVLTPGSLLYVPRGAWHETEAEGDALALNFTFTAPSWIDLFTAALRSRLLMSTEWRETADLSEEKFDELLAELKADLPHWWARDILSVTELK